MSDGRTYEWKRLPVLVCDKGFVGGDGVTTVVVSYCQQGYLIGTVVRGEKSSGSGFKLAQLCQQGIQLIQLLFRNLFCHRFVAGFQARADLFKHLFCRVRQA